MHSRLRQHEEAAHAFRQLEADRRAQVDEAALCAFIAALAHAGRTAAAAKLLPRVNAMAAAAGETLRVSTVNASKRTPAALRRPQSSCRASTQWRTPTVRGHAYFNFGMLVALPQRGYGCKAAAARQCNGRRQR